MPKAFASDFDKTLFFWGEGMDGYISPEDLESIAAFQAAGNLFGVATGRSLKGITMQIGDLIPFDFFIMATGALVLDGDQRVIARHCVDAALMEELNAAYEPSGAMIIFHGNDTVYSLGEPGPMQTHVDSVADIGPNLYGMSMFVGSEERAVEVAAEINGAYGGLVSAFPNSRIIDIAPAGCSKGRAVAFVKEHFGVEAIAAMGDSFNDAPMFESADVSFTFNASPEAVRASADHLVDSVADALRVFCG